MADLFVRIDDDLKKELDILSAREGRTLKDIVIEQIKDYVKTHKEGNPQHIMDKFLADEDFIGFPAMAISSEKKKEYVKNYLIQDGDRLTPMGQELWAHICDWQESLRKY